MPRIGSANVLHTTNAIPFTNALGILDEDSASLAFTDSSNVLFANTLQIAPSGIGTGFDANASGSLLIGATNASEVVIGSTSAPVKSPNKTLILNSESVSTDATLVGILISEGGTDAQGFLRVSSNRANLEFKAPAGNTLTLDVNSDVTFQLSGGLTVEAASFVNQDLTTDNAPQFTGMVLSEGADHPDAPTAGLGQIWVKNDTPNNLYFTDDAGNDYLLNGAAPASLRRTISQAGHGFTLGADIGTAVYINGSGDYVEAQANNANTLGVFLVSDVFDTDTFEIIIIGYLSGINSTTLTANEFHFVSESTAGLLTDTEPSTDGDFSNPIFLADSTSSGYVLNWRPNQISEKEQAFTYRSAFNSNSSGTPIDYSAGILTVTHSLGVRYLNVSIYDDGNEQIIPDGVTATSTNVVTVDLSSYTVGASPDWHIVVTT